MKLATAPKRSISGIKPTGVPHLGNYLGMIRPAIELQKTHETRYFIADYHALTSVRDPKQIAEHTRAVAASFIAFGLDTERGILYRQSDLPEVTELAWLLSCTVSMGDLFRAHAFKAAKDRNEEGELNLGVFSYPVLMAADILIHDADVVPVGKDQVQHLEMARAIAKRFNFHFGPVFKEPQELLQPDVATVLGTDGRKMSKSYNNGIEPLAAEKVLKSQVMSIVTDSKGLEDAKDPETCHIFAIYKLFATPDEQNQMAERYRAGHYGYGHAKLALLEKIKDQLGGARTRFAELMSKPQAIDEILTQGVERLRPQARAVLNRARLACGLGAP